MASLSRWWWNLVRFGFRLLYNELAFTYDWVSYVVSLGEWRKWIDSSLNYLKVSPGSWILELAHGTGNLQLDLAAAGYQSIGYDLSPYMGRIAQRKLRKANRTARLVRGQAQHLPFPSGAFSAVISTFPTDFIFAAQTLNEVYRVLQPGGQFIIVPNGVLTTGGAARAGLEWLYRITGQREGDSEFSPQNFFAAYGFEAEFISHPLPRSVAHLILARKKV